MSFDPDYPGARTSLARSYYSLGLVRLQAEQSDSAIKLLESAVLYEKDNSNMHFALGLAYLASEKILWNQQKIGLLVFHNMIQGSKEKLSFSEIPL